MADSVSASPSNPYLRRIADFLRYVQEQDKPELMPAEASPFSLAAKFLLPKAKTVENLAYGNLPITMAPSGTGSRVPIVKTGRKEEVADILSFAMGGVPGGKVAADAITTGGNKLTDVLVRGITGNPMATGPQVLEEAGNMVPLSRIFIGPKSKKWDWQNLAEAQKMETAGKSVQDIFRRTKTARLPSGEWVQEISDEPAKMTKKELVSTYYPDVGRYAEGFKLSDVFEHPELFEAYPQLKDISGSFKRVTSSSDVANYSPGMNWISYNEKIFRKPLETPERQAKIDALQKELKEFDNDPKVKKYDEFWEKNENLFEENRTAAEKAFQDLGGTEIEKKRSDITKRLMEAKSEFETKAGVPRVMLDSPRAKPTTLHEIAHAVENIEGWPRGGNPGEMAKFLDEEAFQKIEAAHDPLMARFNELRSKYANDQNPPEEVVKEVTNLKRRIKELQDQAKLLTEIKTKFGSSKDYSEKELFDAYNRLQGEAVARLVERRASLTPAQRGQFFPFEMRSESNPYGFDVEPSKMLRVKNEKLIDPLTMFLTEPAGDPLEMFVGLQGK